MPFQNTYPYSFNESTVNSLMEVGGVYGLAQPQLWKPGWFTILYVGKTGNLRERLQHWLNNPPVAGITHFFAEVIANPGGRTMREAQLIAEFRPVGNALLK